MRPLIRSSLVALAALTGVAARVDAQRAGPQRELATHARMVSAVNVRLRNAPSYNAAVDSFVPLGTVVVVNQAKQPPDTSWVYVELTMTGAPGYIHRSMLRRIPQRGGPAMAEAIAAERLARRGDPFAWRVQLYDMLTHQRDMPADSERMGRIALLWMQSFRSMLGSIPLGDHEREPYRSWFMGRVHDGFISLDESTGTWQIASEPLFAVHDLHRDTRAGDEIAWTVRQMGVRHRCGARAACIIASLDQLDAEYLRRNPEGLHAAEALQRVRTAALAAVSAPVAADRLDPIRDCKTIERTVASVRAAVAATTVAPRVGFRGVRALDRARTLAAVDSLAARCRG